LEQFGICNSLYTILTEIQITMTKEYVKPALIDLNEKSGHGRTPCQNGSGAVGYCDTGNVAAFFCGTGTAGQPE
jgi:SynChlorMet cassette protein ScmA